MHDIVGVMAVIAVAALLIWAGFLARQVANRFLKWSGVMLAAVLALAVSSVGALMTVGLVKQHAEHDPSGYLITDDRMMTSIPGLFAAGDVRAQLTRQITTAVGDATTAAIAVEKYLAERRSQPEPKARVGV